jgi:hypothetical protein
MAMALNQVPNGLPVSAADVQRARVQSDGLGGHPYVVALLNAQGAKAGRDLADAVHLLCAVHGRYPGLVAIAATHASNPVVKSWLEATVAAFETERDFLLRLTASVGPIPSTPGAAQSEASLVAARHAIETLGHSEREGCALGAASALVRDWRTVRQVLDRAATRVAVDSPGFDLPSMDDGAVLDGVAASPAASRAMSFGTEQLLLQHRALFSLMEARAEARGDF